MAPVRLSLLFSFLLVGSWPASVLGQACVGAPDGTACLTLGTCEAGVCVTPVGVTRVRLGAARSGDDGSIFVKGAFDTFPPGDVPFGIAAGITVRVTDGLGVDSTVAWSPTDCVTLPSGRIRCTGADAPRKARFAKRRSSPTLWQFTLRLKRFTFQAPVRGPVTVTLSTGSGVDRRGAIAECTASFDEAALNCRRVLAP